MLVQQVRSGRFSYNGMRKALEDESSYNGIRGVLVVVSSGNVDYLYEEDGTIWLKEDGTPAREEG